MLRKLNPLFLFFIALFCSMSAIAATSTVRDLFQHPGDPVAGNPKGKVTVVEFFDYQCGHCVSMAPVMSEIIKTNPNVRVIFKEYPIRGELSVYAARAALAANKQGKYYPFSHALLMNAQSLTPQKVLQIAKQQGLNVEKLKKDMRASGITAELTANSNMARELNVIGTPAFFIGPSNAKSSNSVNFVEGEMSQSELQDAINKAGA